MWELGVVTYLGRHNEHVRGDLRAGRTRGVRRKPPALGRVAHSAHLVPRHARLRRLDALVQAERLLLHNRVLAHVVRHRRPHVALRAEAAHGTGGASEGVADRLRWRVAARIAKETHPFCMSSGSQWEWGHGQRGHRGEWGGAKRAQQWDSEAYSGSRSSCTLRTGTKRRQMFASRI